jgi:hypothetical protein
LALMPHFHHADSRHEHCERNNKSGNDCSPEIAKQEKQNGNNEQRAFTKVLANRFNCSFNEIGTIQNGFSS